MHQRLCFVLLIIAQIGLVGGCANRSIANVSPGTDLGKTKSFYVVKHARYKRDVARLVHEQLVKRGYAVTTGPELPAADYRANILATYQDRWAWDIVPYMIELNITFRVPESGFPMANGNSLHTSLTRKSPEEMVEEVLSSIFDKAKQNP